MKQATVKPVRQQKSAAKLTGTQILQRVCFFVTGFFVLASLIVYGVNVHYSVKLNELGKNSRNLHEKNKELHVKLNRLTSYKNLETSVERVPYLTESTDRIEVVNLAHPKLPVFQPPEKKLPDIYGY